MRRACNKEKEASHDAERVSQASQIAQLQAQISKRDSKPLPKEIQAGLQSTSSATEVNAALTAAYSSVPSFGTTKVSPDGQNVLLSLPQGQQVILTQEKEMKESADLTDEKSTISLLNTANASLSGDLNQCKVLNTKAEADIAAFKKLATRSRWQKFLGGFEKVGLVMAGAAIGHMI